MRMKAAVLWEQNKPMTVEEIELDEPKDDEVLVKMVASGVCHSDVHFYTGDNPTSVPRILGHEGAGIVQKVGSKVEKLKAGDHVVLTFMAPCGECKWCHVGQPTLCNRGARVMTGKMLDGTTRHHLAKDGRDVDSMACISTYAEYSITYERALVKVPEWLPLEKLVLFGCGFTTGFGAATNAAHIRPGETVTIVGVGGLGLAAVQGARASGAGKIIAVDVAEEKLTLARKLGATHTVLNRKNVDEVVKEIMDITWGEGTDYSFEFVGFDQSKNTLDIAFKAIRKGGRMFMVGVGRQQTTELPINPRDLVHYRKNIQGVLYGDAQLQVDIPRYVELYEKGKIDLDSMVTRECKLEDINTCFQNLIDGKVQGRQVIRFDQ